MKIAEAAFLGRGIYSVQEAAALTGVSARRLRRWLLGYEFRLHGEPRLSEKILDGELPSINGTSALSFLDLQEARCIAEFRKRGVGWQSLREAHTRGQSDLRTSHPFGTGQFKTVGRRLMWDAATEENDGILLDIARSQTSFRSVLAQFLRGIEFLNDRPVRWFPLSGSKRIVIDPRRNFGRPIVKERGVPTAILAQSYDAEGSFEKVSRWYEVDIRSVKDAVRFEHDIAA
ncbi:MAG: DUF433 domain-containing protein [Deltaproteobacteria bacterium]|nr:DUF433 domain-containing protein [Deltaproteobacteria bacterium]